MNRDLIRLALVSLIAAALLGCRGPRPGASVPVQSDVAVPSVSIRIGLDGPELPDEAAALQAYGAQHADEFGGMWVEDQSRGSFVMLFTDHLDDHAAAVTRIWPRVTVRGVRHTEVELRELQDALAKELFGAEGIELLSAGVDIKANLTQVTLKSDDPGLEQRLEAAHPGMLDAHVFPFPGPWANVESGDGWRLLATGDPPSEVYTVRAATNAREWEAMWEAIGLDSHRPAVDFDTDIVVSFGHGLSKSCPELRLDDVRIAGRVVYSVTSDPLSPRSCNLDLSADYVFVVALARTALPADRVTVQLSRDEGPGCPDCGFTPILEVELP